MYFDREDVLFSKIHEVEESCQLLNNFEHLNILHGWGVENLDEVGFVSNFL